MTRIVPKPIPKLIKSVIGRRETQADIVARREAKRAAREAKAKKG